MITRIALIGGEEFTDGFDSVYARLLALTRSVNSRNGRPIKVVFLPTCAADDGLARCEYWCDQARRRLGGPGIIVSTLLIIDRQHADDQRYATMLAEADMIYIGGGYPHVGMRILSGTRALKALLSAHRRGALIVGASAGAMLLCSDSWIITPEVDAAITAIILQEEDPGRLEKTIPSPLKCLGLVPGSLCWPHFDLFFSPRLLELGMAPPMSTVIGIDEQTAAVTTTPGIWHVIGKRQVTIFNPARQEKTFREGMSFSYQTA